MFIAKYDSSGSILWALSSTKGQCEPTSLTTDKDGNLLVLMISYADTLLFGDSVIVNPNFDHNPFPAMEKNKYFFIMKVTPDGHLAWCNRGGGSIEVFGAIAKIGGIATDAGENIYVLMSFDDTALRIEGHTFMNSRPDSGDIFLVKYDMNGHYLWTRTWGGPGDDQGDRIRVGKNNKLYISGFFNSPSVAMGSTTLVQNGSMYSGMDYTTFIAELDTGGNVLWATTPVGNSRPMMITLDTADNIYISGQIIDTTMAFGTHTMTNRRLDRGSFVAKYDNTGSAQWVKFIYPLSITSFGSFGTRAHGMTIDSCNNLWFACQLPRDSIAMNGTTISSTLPPPASMYETLLFAGLSPSGTLLQSHIYPGGGDDHAELLSDCAGYIYMVSATTQPFKLGTDTIYRHGAENMFVAKFDPALGCIGDTAYNCDGKQPVNSFLAECNTIAIYPNPANSQLTVMNGKKMSHIAVYDITGRQVIAVDCTDKSKTIDVGSLRHGLYLVRVDGLPPMKFLKE